MIDMEIFKIMGRAINEFRGGAGQGGEKMGVGLVPGVAYDGFTQNLENRLLPLHQQHPGRSAGGKLGVQGHVFPVVFEIPGGEGVAIGPAMSLAQVKGENSAVLDVEFFQQVGNQFEISVVADESGITVNHH